MAWLHLRLPEAEKAALEKAAAREHVTMTAFVRRRLLADLTGEALATRVAERLEQTLGESLAKLDGELAAHREDFGAFRKNLSRALEAITHEWRAPAKSGGAGNTRETVR